MRKKLSEMQPGQKFLVHAYGAVFQMIGKCVSDYYAVQNVKTLSILELSDAEYKVVTEPKYRPFANAKEFGPHRDRWWRWKSSDSDVHIPPCSFRDSGHYTDTSWGQSLDNKVFDDGSPFGVLEE